MANTKDLQESFKSSAALETSLLQLKKENKALKDTVSKLLAELNNVRDIDTGKVTKLVLTPEEEICTLQIQQLQAVSRERKLSLEEIKTLDLLIKNKRLLNKQSTANNTFETLPPELSDAELLEIAASVEKEKEEGPESRTS